MSVALYMDHQVPRAISVGLRLKGVDVLTVYEDGASEADDTTLLERALELNRLLFTRDDDFLAEAARRQAEGIPFGGIVYAHQLRVSIGACIQGLEIIATAAEPEDARNQIIYLPL